MQETINQNFNFEKLKQELRKLLEGESYDVNSTKKADGLVIDDNDNLRAHMFMWRDHSHQRNTVDPTNPKWLAEKEKIMEYLDKFSKITADALNTASPEERKKILDIISSSLNWTTGPDRYDTNEELFGSMRPIKDEIYDRIILKTLEK